MPHFTDIAIIYNPNSTGDAERNAVGLRKKLQLALPAMPIKLLPTQRAGHAVELAYDFAKSHKRPLIVSASGDGGYNEVVNGIVQAQNEGARPIAAVLPSGNANDHARTMQNNELWKQIAGGKVKQLDLLQVTTTPSDGKKVVRYAHSYVGIGLTPTVAVELNKHTLNSLREGLIILKTFWKYKPVTIISAGKKVHVDSIICSLIPEMAKVLTITDKAHPHDGLFELTVFEHNRKLKLLYRLVRGVVKNLGVQKQLKNYSFSLLNPAPIQLDGEVMQLKGGTKVSVVASPDKFWTVV